MTTRCDWVSTDWQRVSIIILARIFTNISLCSKSGRFEWEHFGVVYQ